MPTLPSYVLEAYELFSKTLCISYRWRPTSSQKSLGTPWRGKLLAMRAPSDVIPKGLVPPHQITVTGENLEVETEIENYTLTKIQTFLLDFMQQEGERGINWLITRF